MENKENGLHKIKIEQRKCADISGVCDVESFDLKHILLETNMGMLEIKGEDLKVKKVSLDSGEFRVCGRINSFQYFDTKDYRKKGKSLLKKAFR